MPIPTHRMTLDQRRARIAAAEKALTHDESIAVSHRAATAVMRHEGPLTERALIGYVEQALGIH